MKINETNDNINYLIHHIHNRELDKFFKKAEEVISADENKENGMRVVANVLRIFFLKEESSFNFINDLTEEIKSNHSEWLEYSSMKISLDVLDLITSKISKQEAVDGLLEKAQIADDFKDKMHAMCYLGNLILSSGNTETNEKYFEELEKLKGDKEYIVDNLNFDKVTTRFNYDHYEILIKVTEIRLQKALIEEDKEKINSLMEEIIETTKKLKETSAVDDYQRITVYSVAKMSRNSGYIDLEDYFMQLYNQIEDLKGYVLESYFDYLNINYPARIDSDFREIANTYFENHYENDDPESKKAFLFVMIDFISSYGSDKINLDEVLSEIDKLEKYKY